ncbi:hypothetical protein AB835_10220 [Candidatus Endobugula sertula]|uniref:RNA polymerase-associated protein RapA n=1 Tax=Candidatus Endobugula sertula TaxID=62101 RepID=A0A1D2QNS7_9GAMM|nr:hypothetical protein AB835_10220 [Candidatus Endobugula sertula]
MSTPQIGQRWMVDTDSSLGLGIVTECDTRSVTIDFPAMDHSRCYSLDNSPLTRVLFTVGDNIEAIDGEKHIVAQVEAINNLVIYLTNDGEAIPETRLASTLEFNHPVKRLLVGQLDKPKWFDLRTELAKSYHRWLRSDVIGLQGARITLTPHQLYVAETATQLGRSRVLLADEVGLGKTIEAGLILQRLLLQEQVQRVLILVPDALRVQWFVELVRCFNIHAVLWGEDVDLSEPRVFIVAHRVLDGDTLLTDAPWDMTIVDEAHHFNLMADNPVVNTLKTIGETCEHLLLLSATPERMGLEQHFSRLQLLDPARFYDFAAFQQQYDHYESLADDVTQLLESEIVEPSLQQRLSTLFPHIADIKAEDKADIIHLLLDCHGTGRVVFRNTRTAITGFPDRRLVTHVLPDEVDADLNWLAGFLKQHKDEKILFITHDKDDVLDIRESLYRKMGIDCPVFHEGMSLIERDRAAAYFADKEEGAPLLLCSEIGSEGRNFQFCHHLICWDLPEHPDVLEQRIGRLDRIGQKNVIKIHVCVTNTVSQARLDWFHSILNCVEKTNPAAGVMHDQWYGQYQQNPKVVGEKVKQQTQQWLEQLQNGRDRLLEMNSCRQPQANQLVDTVRRFEEENNPENLLVMATDLLNIHMEYLGESRFSLIPSEQMLVPMIPGIPAEGCEITFDRTTATTREDVQFITWDHPLMQGLTELITTSDLGVATVALFPNKALKPGMLFLEVIFRLTIKDSVAVVANSYLSKSLLRVVVTLGDHKNLQGILPQDTLAKLIENASQPIRKVVVRDYQKEIQALFEQAQKIAQEEMQGIIQQSLSDLEQRSHLEQVRMEQLQERNDYVSAADVEQQKQHYSDMAIAIKAHCKLEVSAVRLLVTRKPERV